MYAGLSLVIVIFENLPQERIYQFHGNILFLSWWKDLLLVEEGPKGKSKNIIEFCPVILIGFSLYFFICS